MRGHAAMEGCFGWMADMMSRSGNPIKIVVARGPAVMSAQFCQAARKSGHIALEQEVGYGDLKVFFPQSDATQYMLQNVMTPSRY